MFEEIIGTLALILGVLGAVLNNRKLRVCFLIWMVSNTLSAGIHISVGVWSMLIRDIVFFILVVEGWFKWKKKKKND